MANELYEATIQGNVELLLELIQEDPLILDRSVVTTYEETPLHVAAMLGHEQFCVQLLRLKPELARELDCRGSSALHLASAKGHLGTLKALVLVDPDMCLARDNSGRNPCHIAAIKGRISVMKELLQVKPDAARAVVNRDGTILHLCVEYCRFEALKLLLENVDFQEFINLKESNGNTILHLAVADKQIQTIDYLLKHTMVDVNAVNAYGSTAMDILLQSRKDKIDMDIAEILRKAGALKAETNLPTTRPDSLHRGFLNIPLPITNSLRRVRNQISWEHYFEKHDDWMERQHDALMVVASLIASMGFTAGITPPNGLLQDQQHDPRAWADSYNRFLVYNTISFMSSISIILLLVSGMPFKHRVFMWILMVIVWVTVASTACTYAVSIENHVKYTDFPVLGGLVGFGFLSWLIIMLIVLAFHANRIYVMLLRKFKNPSRVYERQIGIEAV